MFAKEI